MIDKAITNGHVVRTRGLTKRYGEVRAVDAVDLEVSEGDVYGFLGATDPARAPPCGCFSDSCCPPPVTLRCWGSRCLARRAVLPRIGALVEGPGAYPHLSGRANLALLEATGSDRSARGHRKARIVAALEQVGLDPGDRRPTRAYSLGMRQRLGLAAALMRQPRLLVLDEPTNGLDPQGIQAIRRLLDLNQRGTTILLSSHLLAEVEQMCTRVGVLDRGRLVLQQRLDVLLRPTGLVDVRTPDAFAARPCWAMTLCSSRVSDWWFDPMTRPN